jgi:IS1 family transposase
MVLNLIDYRYSASTLHVREHSTIMDAMNKLSLGRRASILRALVEGNSVRSTARLTATAKATVLKLLVEVGDFCSIYQDHVLRNLKCRNIQADEIWSFVGAKQRNVTEEVQGDIWTYTALDSDSKLMVSWLVGSRNSENTKAFMADVAERLANRVQLTTDGLGWYIAAVEGAFGWNGVDFAQVVKAYGQPMHQPEHQRRYSPPVCIGASKTVIMGKPDVEKVSTSHVERSNLSMRMGMRRFTRLTNAFSKKAENHAHAVSLYFMQYNFCRVHTTLTKARGGLHTTPAMAAGVTNRVWSVEDILNKMDPQTLLQSN